MLLADDQTWHVHHGDCIEHMATMPKASVDFSVFSPPFPSLFAYTSEGCDIGNSEDVQGEGKLHLSFFFRQLRRVMKPGRSVIVHVMQIPRLARSGGSGTVDFRGLNIRIAERAGFIFEYDWLVGKNPQSQAIRTHATGLLFVTLERDRAAQRGAHGDYLIKLKTPGDNKVPINSDEITREEWIQWAECYWPWCDIRQTDTLNTREAKGDDDTKHICPLQLPVINRVVKLFSNPGETVFSPFAGIGSEGYESIKLGRKFYGCEIKDEYVATAKRNLDKAITTKAENEKTLWSASA